MANMSSQTKQDFGGNTSQFGNKPKDAATDVLDKVKQGAASVGETASKKIGDVTSAVGGGMKNLGEKIRESLPNEGYLGQASQSVASTLEGGGKYLAEEGLSGLADDVGAIIKRNPFPAVLVGLGLGFLIARISRK